MCEGVECGIEGLQERREERRKGIGGLALAGHKHPQVGRERERGNNIVSIALIQPIDRKCLKTYLTAPTLSSRHAQFILHNATLMLQALSLLSLVRLMFQSQPHSILWDALAVVVLAVGGVSRY